MTRPVDVFLVFIAVVFKLWCRTVSQTQRMLIFTITWLFIVCCNWLRTGWTHSCSLSDTTTRPVRMEVELFLVLWLPPCPSVLHSVSSEEPLWSMRVCWFPQFRTMRSRCQDKQTRKGENSCWNRSPKSQLDMEGLALARKTKSWGQIVVTGVLKGDINVPRLEQQSPCLWWKASLWKQNIMLLHTCPGFSL